MNYKIIKLTKGKCTKVDSDMFDYLNQWRWKYHKDNYAVRTITGDKSLYMHRVINETPKGLFTDHINRNGLDNRESNLRTITNSQNLFNTGIFKHNTSGIKGVTFNKQKNKWKAGIQLLGKQIHLGFYINIKDAEKARKEGELKYVRI